jgi:putative transcriptional regulator
MTIHHHPDDAILTGFTAGTLDLGQHVAVATHLVACPRCRAWAHSLEQVGGAVLAELPPAGMSADALVRLEARLGAQAPTILPSLPEAPPTLDLPGLPGFVRRYRAEPWKGVAPHVSIRPIHLPEPSESRVFLLRSGPGTRMLRHTHTGIEMTCVLTGAFDHEGGHFGPGDFDLGDESVDHRPAVDADAPCVCLVAMNGDLRLDGILGRIMQPFLRL